MYYGTIVAYDLRVGRREERGQYTQAGLDFADASEIFTAPMLVIIDDRQDYGEERWIGIGMLRGRVVVIAYTERAEDTLRIISLRKALNHERTHYESTLRDRLG